MTYRPYGWALAAPTMLLFITSMAIAQSTQIPEPARATPDSACVGYWVTLGAANHPYSIDLVAGPDQAAHSVHPDGKRAVLRYEGAGPSLIVVTNSWSWM